jgi:DnaJ-class molecular chaperone
VTDPLKCLTDVVRQMVLDWDRCPACDGYGEIEIEEGYCNWDGEIQPKLVDCPECDGTGAKRRAQK